MVKKATSNNTSGSTARKRCRKSGNRMFQKKLELAAAIFRVVFTPNRGPFTHPHCATPRRRRTAKVRVAKAAVRGLPRGHT